MWYILPRKLTIKLRMKSFLVMFVLAFLCVEKSLQTSPPHLEVTLYYESLCPYSIDFIKEQLYPAYQKIGSYLSVDFVPYGNANQTKVNGKWHFECQHEEAECWGNKAQACGLAAEKEETKTVDFINCMMSQDDPASKDAVNHCASKLEVTAESIFTCITEKGDELLAALGDKTKLVDDEISGVPALAFNNRYDPKVDSEAVSDFLGTACSFLGNQPENCPSEDNKLTED